MARGLSSGAESAIAACEVECAFGATAVPDGAAPNTEAMKPDATGRDRTDDRPADEALAAASPSLRSPLSSVATDAAAAARARRLWFLRAVRDDEAAAAAAAAEGDSGSDAAVEADLDPDRGGDAEPAGWCSPLAARQRSRALCRAASILPSIAARTCSASALGGARGSSADGPAPGRV